MKWLSRRLNFKLDLMEDCLFPALLILVNLLLLIHLLLIVGGLTGCQLQCSPRLTFRNTETLIQNPPLSPSASMINSGEMKCETRF